MHEFLSMDYRLEYLFTLRDEQASKGRNIMAYYWQKYIERVVDISARAATERGEAPEFLNEIIVGPCE